MEIWNRNYYITNFQSFYFICIFIQQQTQPLIIQPIIKANTPNTTNTLMQSNKQLRSSNNLSLQFLLQPQIKLTHIENNHYFILVHKKSNKALSYKPSTRYEAQHAILSEPDENDIQQIFLIQEIKDDKFEIVHGISTLVLTNQQNEVMLNFGNWKSNQFFYPQKIDNSNCRLEYWIKSRKNQGKYLYYDGFALRCRQRDSKDQDLIWEIRLCLHNARLNKTCWLEYAFSNQVVDIPQAQEKQDINLIQYPCNYRFNQRFHIQQSKSAKDHWTIQNLKTLQLLTVSQNPFFTNVVQQYQKGNVLKQLWKIQYVGNGLYTIRSALRQNMYLIVKERSSKLSEELGISDNQQWCLWKIVGNFNIMPNKDFKF